MKLSILPAALLSLGLILNAQAQQAVTGEFAITSIAPSFLSSPTYSGVQYDKRGTKARQWLEVEVTFDYAPKKKDEKYASEVTVSYYILLNNADVNKDRKPTLLTGTVTHVDVPSLAVGGKGLHSVAYVSPRTLERFFDGKAPGTLAQAVRDVGVTISAGGQLGAEKSWKGKGQWWPQYQAVSGSVLNKNETPFAPLQWDYYEVIKAAPGR